MKSWTTRRQLDHILFSITLKYFRIFGLKLTFTIECRYGNKPSQASTEASTGTFPPVLRVIDGTQELFENKSTE
jgi:hypothetical protein